MLTTQFMSWTARIFWAKGKFLLEITGQSLAFVKIKSNDVLFERDVTTDCLFYRITGILGWLSSAPVVFQEMAVVGLAAVEEEVVDVVDHLVALISKLHFRRICECAHLALQLEFV